MQVLSKKNEICLIYKKINGIYVNIHQSATLSVKIEKDEILKFRQVKIHCVGVYCQTSSCFIRCKLLFCYLHVACTHLRFYWKFNLLHFL